MGQACANVAGADYVFDAALVETVRAVSSSVDPPHVAVWCCRSSVTCECVDGTFSSPPGGDEPDTPDPVSWLQIEPGWSVVGSDGNVVGAVLSVAGVKQDDIFDGLAISAGSSGTARYVPGEQVGMIVPGKVTLRLVAAAAEKLEPFVPDKPATVWRPSAPSLGSRISNWLRGKR